MNTDARDTRGKSATTRERIREGARRVFFDRGYEGASMADIAKAAGVSKGTLYVHFPDKEGLFSDVMGAECDSIRARNFVFDDRASLEQSLFLLGQGFLFSIFAPNAMGLYRALVGEAHRQPSLGQAFMDAGPRPGTRALAALLEAAIARGDVQIEDTDLAAHQFIHLCDSGLSQRAHMGEGVPATQEIERHVRSAVQLFLRGYRPRL